MSKVRIINGIGDWTATPPTGVDDGAWYQLANEFIASSGVFLPEFGNAMVTESAAPGMSVQVNPGIIYVFNSAWTPNSTAPRYYQVVRDSTETGITISSNPSGLTRYDAICQEVDKITEPNDDGSNVAPIIVVEGTPGDFSITIPDNCEILAVVEVIDGQTVITDSDIFDFRNKVVAMPGFVSPDIQIYEDDTTIEFDLEMGRYNKFWAPIEGNRNLDFINVPAGFPFLVYVQQANGGGHTPTLPGNIVTTDGDPIEWSEDDGAIDVIGLVLLPTGDYQATVVSNNLQ